MQTEEIRQRLSDNHQLLIIAGGAISFISLFLPFWVGFGETATSYEDQTFHFSVSMFNTGFFWIYLLLIIGLFYGYYRGYGDQYPHLYLVIGMATFLMTSCADKYQPVESLLSYSYGFILELIGSFAIATGGYFYYITKTGLNKISNKGE
jgi:hypothetical protein